MKPLSHSLLAQSRMRRNHLLFRFPKLILATLVLFFPGLDLRADALERLKPEQLEATHKALAKLQSARKEINLTGPYLDFRANLHVHSAFSHDSRGKISEIVAAAKKAGTHVILFTEHPTDKYDFFIDGHQGLNDGVLLIPGAETNGFLTFPRKSIKGMEGSQKQEFSDLVRRTGGLTFLSHLEERMEWNIRDITGVEIYNTHAVFKDQKKLVSSLKNPFGLIKMGKLVNQYPQECFSALHEYPGNYLKRWDELCKTAPHVGVSANDAHQNIGLKIILKENNKAAIESALGEKLLEVDASLLSTIQPVPKDAKPGDIVFQFLLDPYQYSLRHVGTHLLLKDLKTESVWDSLEKGRCFVAFDWIADATGFEFFWRKDNGRGEMGSSTGFTADIRLKGQSSLPAHWKIIKDGKLAIETDGAKLDYKPTGPGNYRAEVWIKVEGEDRIWILSNPIYLK